MKTIIFDESSANWTERPNWNIGFLKAKRVYLMDLFNRRGYMYLDRIYEEFGIKWNPGMVNSLYLEKSGPLVIEFEPIEDGKILIHIS